jgi:hypothetical protein
MTPTDLERLAGAVNAKWPEGGQCRAHETYVDLHHPTKPEYIWDYFQSLPDQGNAEFIVWALDRLEELGLTPSVFKGSSGEYVVSIPEIPDAAFGPTRAAALTKALSVALGAE